MEDDEPSDQIVRKDAAAVGRTALGALAVGAFALGAFAAGAVALGVVAIGRLQIGDVRIGRLKVGELELPTSSVRDEESEIRRIIEDWAKAVRGKDFPGILRRHHPDIVMFDVPPPFAIRGLEAYRKTWEPFFSWVREPVVFDIKEIDVTTGSDVAFAVAAMQCAGKEPEAGRPVLDFRLTIGLQKIDGKWTIVHEHHSVPAPE